MVCSSSRSLAVFTLVLSTITALAVPLDRSLATDRRFGYVYGSSTLNPGSVEVEPWTTFRLGREETYRGFDQRVEFEAGLTDRLQTAFYLNWTAVAAEVDGVLASESTWQGVSSEWKLKFTDPVADPVGFALYLEPGFGPDEAEVEGKVILDARRGDWYAAFNAGADHEWEFQAEETEREVGIDLDLGLSYSLSPTVSAGIEMHNPTTIPAGEEVESSALFAGPVLSYAAESWWTTITVLPQIHAWKGATQDGLALDDHERIEVRILLGFDL